MKLDIAYAKSHIKCDCGHYAKDHYLAEGWCQHPKAGECGCTWYYPNVRWLKKTKKEDKEG